MLSFQRILVALVAMAAFLLMPGEESNAVPGAGGSLLFSVNAIGPAHDITPAPSGPITCTAADILAPPGAFAGLCAARVPPAPAGPVPLSVSFAPGDLGLDLAGVFTDDLDGLSYGEVLGVTVPAADFDFSVDAAPPVGVTTAAGLSCGAGPSDVTIEAAALQAQGDIFTTAGTPPGCNTQFTDELALGLIAPNPGFPPMPPLDDMDALAELPLFLPGASCTLFGGLFISARCPAFSVDAASAVLGAPIAPDGCFGLFGDAASILVPPGTPPILPCLPAGCPPPGGIPCNAVSSAALGLVPADDLDALCWFDADGDLLPDLPNFFIPGAGDYYLFSLTPASPTLGGIPAGPADILTPAGPGGPAIAVPAASLGLLPTDDLDALICHDLDTDGDSVPDLLDNCLFVANPAQTDTDADGIGDACELDFDGDGVFDAAEGPCGSDPADPSVRPERLDGVFVGFSDDGDLPVDEALPVGSAGFDCDGDGWTGTQESLIYTSPVTATDQDPCGNNGWPSDLAPNPPPFSILNIADVGSFLTPNRAFDGHAGPIGLSFNKFNHTLDDTAPFDGVSGIEALMARWNLALPPHTGTTVINIGDLGALLNGAVGSPARPPMFGGLQAFFTSGGVCPWPA